MKRIVILLVICFFFAAPLTAYADAIVETDNAFYNRHRSELVSLGREFCANGEDGYTSVKKQPGSGSDQGILQNGEDVYIQDTCLYNGEYWGFTYGFSGGWIKMDQVLVLYDGISFAEDHSDEFYNYEGNYDELEAAGGAIIWPWPGAAEQMISFDNFTGGDYWASTAWRDEDGREWGFVSGIYGRINGWICLSDPLNYDLPVLSPLPEPRAWEPDKLHVDIGQSGNPMIVLIIVLVAAIAVGTIVIVKVFWKRRLP